MEPFDLTDEQVALQETVARWASDVDERQRGEPIASSAEVWGQLAELGVLALGTADGGGGAVEVSICAGELGRVGFPGPLVPALMAGQVLESGPFEAVARGDSRVAVAAPDEPIPWGWEADVYILDLGEHMCVAEPAGALVPVRSLGDENWARGELVAVGSEICAASAHIIGDLAVASYVWGAATEAVRRAADYARERRQFGHAVGDFQGVAFPLGEAISQLHGVRALTLLAAQAFDSGLPAGPIAAAASQVAGSWGSEACRTAHQACGGMGYAVEGPMTILSRRAEDVRLCRSAGGRLVETITSRQSG